MTSLYIDRKDASLSLLGNALEIRLPGRPPERLPLDHAERIVLHGAATLSTGFLAQAWERGISVLILSGRRGEATARFHGAPHNDAAIRLAQMRANLDPARRAAAVRFILRGKLLAQRRLLATLAAHRNGGRGLASDALAALGRASLKLRNRTETSLDALRGGEGAAAAAYFRAYARFFTPSLGFAQRLRRPPPDPVNAALSLGYTLATFEAGRAAEIAGLDPAIGFLHDLAHGRHALALDLVEPLRPRVDLMVHDLFHDRRLTGRHFAGQPDGAVLLGKAGRALFYAAWEEAAPPLRRHARSLARQAVRALRHAPGPAHGD